jgi:hypothetical protein
MVQWLLGGLLSVMHPFFVSVIEINHNAKTAEIEVSVRIFSADLEKTLQKNNTARIDILHPADKALLDRQINQYISKNLRLKANGQSVALNYVGHEIQEESIWTYFEVTRIPELKSLAVECTLLYDFEQTQSNIFHVKSKGQDKSYKLDYPKNATVFEF